MKIPIILPLLAVFIVISNISAAFVTQSFSSLCSNPFGIVSDSAGNYYVVISGGIAKLYPDKTCELFVKDLPRLNSLVLRKDGVFFAAGLGGAVYRISKDGTPELLASNLGTVYGMALDTGGVPYVTCNDIGVVKKINADGSAVTVVSGLQYPEGITFDKNNNMFIASALGIHKRNSAGSLTLVNDSVLYGHQLLCDSAGNLFMTFAGYANLAVITPDSVRIYPISSFGSNETHVAFAGPNRLAITMNTQLGGYIVTMDMHGAVTSFIEGMYSPHHIAFDSAGYLYVSSERGIYRIDEQGVLKKFCWVVSSGLAYDSRGWLYAGAWPSSPLYKVLLDTARISISGNLMFVKIIANGTDGTVYYGDMASKIYRLGQSGTPVQVSVVSNPSGLAVDSHNNLYVASQDSGFVFRIAPDGTKDTFAAGLARTAGIYIDPFDNVYLTSLDNNKIIRYAAEGSITTVVDDIGAPASIGFDKSGRLYALSGMYGGIFRTVEQLPCFELVSPAVGDTLTTKLQDTLKWLSIGGRYNVSIELYQNGLKMASIAPSISDAGMLCWTPDSGKAGSGWRIKMTSLKDTSFYAFSDTFSIAKAVQAKTLIRAKEIQAGLLCIGSIIGYHLTKTENVKIDVFSLNGLRISAYYKSLQQPGTYLTDIHRNLGCDKMYLVRYASGKIRQQKVLYLVK